MANKHASHNMATARRHMIDNIMFSKIIEYNTPQRAHMQTDTRTGVTCQKNDMKCNNTNYVAHVLGVIQLTKLISLTPSNRWVSGDFVRALAGAPKL